MPIVTIVTISKQGGLSFVYSCSTICYVNTTLKAQPFLLNTCCPGHPYVCPRRYRWECPFQWGPTFRKWFRSRRWTEWGQNRGGSLEGNSDYWWAHGWWYWYSP